MTLFHLNRLLVAMPVSVWPWETSTTSPSATARTSVPTSHLKSIACWFPPKKCVSAPPSPCVHSHGAPGPPRGNESNRGCSSSGFGCSLQSWTSLSISEVGSASVAACRMERGGRRRMNVTHRRDAPVSSTAAPGGNGAPRASRTGWSYTVT